MRDISPRSPSSVSRGGAIRRCFRRKGSSQASRFSQLLHHGSPDPRNPKSLNHCYPTNLMGEKTNQLRERFVFEISCFLQGFIRSHPMVGGCLGFRISINIENPNQGNHWTRTKGEVNEPVKKQGWFLRSKKNLRKDSKDSPPKTHKNVS